MHAAGRPLRRGIAGSVDATLRIRQKTAPPPVTPSTVPEM